MPIITKITQQKKNKERYNIFLDGKYAFSVDEEVLARYQLGKNKEINDLDIGEIEYEDEIRKGFNKALIYLSYRMRSEHEIILHLREHEMGEASIEETMHKLRKYGYVNDSEFAKAFLNTQLRTSDKGPRHIGQALKDKGIEAGIIEETLAAISQEEWLERAEQVIEKVIKKNPKQSKLQIKKKGQDTLSRKGYEGTVTGRVLSEISIERNEEEKWAAVYSQAKKAHTKYIRKYEGYEYEQRMKQALFRKGFSGEEIEKAIEHLQEEGQSY
ncbi:recombination regulator RecX [Jeotgalibacillus sp. ET6]|uniref:recombination regulator RecX n=1 Tax=Jeotgalibacillus sp. ET6 TaxID=3037260 RepID=UPI00241831D3|nr:recombination regulator RecX [Jeotgalibacillus sp. ET6]MDG5473332.1 recombination regulator RecX [Jeotgalibacillus sp. ET6]